jgi:hypothetical protein
MLERLDSMPGRVMTRPEYHADLKAALPSVSGVCWKLERRQFFNELEDSAWEAFKAGDWDQVMAIFESDRERVTAARGMEFRRLRIVEHPPSAYLRWEMHSHKIFTECGRPIRVLDAKEIAHLEPQGPVPELLTLGEDLLYRVHYTDDMTPDGATRYDDPALAAEVAVLLEELWARAEPLEDYFAREIAPLGPPVHIP